jgi:hypothetical protein
MVGIRAEVFKRFVPAAYVCIHLFLGILEIEYRTEIYKGHLLLNGIHYNGFQEKALCLRVH